MDDSAEISSKFQAMTGQGTDKMKGVFFVMDDANSFHSQFEKIRSQSLQESEAQGEKSALSQKDRKAQVVETAKKTTEAAETNEAFEGVLKETVEEGTVDSQTQEAKEPVEQSSKTEGHAAKEGSANKEIAASAVEEGQRESAEIPHVEYEEAALDELGEAVSEEALAIDEQEKPEGASPEPVQDHVEVVPIQVEQREQRSQHSTEDSEEGTEQRENSSKKVLLKPEGSKEQNENMSQEKQNQETKEVNPVKVKGEAFKQTEEKPAELSVKTEVIKNRVEKPQQEAPEEIRTTALSVEQQDALLARQVALAVEKLQSQSSVAEKFAPRFVDGLKAAPPPAVIKVFDGQGILKGENLLGIKKGLTDTTQKTKEGSEPPKTSDDPRIAKLRAKVVEQLRFQLRMVLRSKSNEAIMHLKPKFLGDVKVKLVTEGTHVSAHFLVENLTVKEVMQREVAQLHDALNERGLSVDTIEVDVSSEYANSKGEGGRSFSSKEDLEIAKQWTGSFTNYGSEEGNQTGNTLPSSSPNDEIIDPDQLLNIVV